MNNGTWLAARLEFNPCHGNKTRLVVYRQRSHADDDRYLDLIAFDLTNEQLTELVCRAKIKPKDMNE